MKLFELLKDRVKDPKGVLSDHEMVLLNRRDFLYGETSPSRQLLAMCNAGTVSYEMYALIDFLYTTISGLRTDSSIYVSQLSRTMTLPALACSVFLGDRSENLKVYAPLGVQQIKTQSPLTMDILRRFEAQLTKLPPRHLIESDCNSSTFEILLANSSSESEVTAALENFRRVTRGVILIKGYGRLESPNCGEVILGQGINIHCSLAGFGVGMAI